MITPKGFFDDKEKQIKKMDKKTLSDKINCGGKLPNNTTIVSPFIWVNDVCSSLKEVMKEIDKLYDKNKENTNHKFLFLVKQILISKMGKELVE